MFHIDSVHGDNLRLAHTLATAVDPLQQDLFHCMLVESSRKNSELVATAVNPLQKMLISVQSKIIVKRSDGGDDEGAAWLMEKESPSLTYTELVEHLVPTQSELEKQKKWSRKTETKGWAEEEEKEEQDIANESRRRQHQHERHEIFFVWFDQNDDGCMIVRTMEKEDMPLFLLYREETSACTVDQARLTRVFLVGRGYIVAASDDGMVFAFRP